jgi:L-asparagine transporter-like permease
MLVLTAFLSICAAGVAFLLRFLFALESDLRVHGKHPARVERIRTGGVPVSIAAVEAAPALVLIHSNPGLARRATAAAGVRVDQSSHVKEA